MFWQHLFGVLDPLRISGIDCNFYSEWLKWYFCSEFNGYACAMEIQQIFLFFCKRNSKKRCKELIFSGLIFPLRRLPRCFRSGEESLWMGGAAPCCWVVNWTGRAPWCFASCRRFAWSKRTSGTQESLKTFSLELKTKPKKPALPPTCCHFDARRVTWIFRGFCSKSFSCCCV